MSELSRGASVLVLGTADWLQPIATNQHYVAREIAAAEPHSLYFVESLGLRTPELSVRDIRRALARLRNRFTSRAPAGVSRPKPPGLQVISPLILPVHSSRYALVNQKLLHSSVRDWIRTESPKVLWTYSPITYGLEDVADVVVYHCVDLLGEIPGVSRELVSSGERQLRSSGAHAIASSAVVRDYLQGEIGFRAVDLWENVADTAVFEAARPARDLTEPRAIFAGNLSRNKVDFALLRELARSGVEVVVAGPHAEGGGNTGTEVEEIRLAGMSYLGHLPLEDLAHEVASSSVGLVPYLKNSYTRGVSPLKTYEYLSAGIPVVSTELPGVTDLRPHVTVCATREEFIEQVHRAWATSASSEAQQCRRQIAAEHSWQRRGQQVRQTIERLLAYRSGSDPDPGGGQP